MLAALRVVADQDQCGAGRQYEHGADQRFLGLFPVALGPGQDKCRQQRGAGGYQLHLPALGRPADDIGDHQAPLLGQANRLYVRAANCGPAYAYNVPVELYAAPLVPCVPPDDWQKIDEATIERVPTIGAALADEARRQAVLAGQDEPEGREEPTPPWMRD